MATNTPCVGYTLSSPADIVKDPNTVNTVFLRADYLADFGIPKNFDIFMSQNAVLHNL